MLDIHCVQFDLTGSSQLEESAQHRGWANGEGLFHVLRVTPVSWRFDLRDLAAATDFFARQCADNRGVMLSLEVVQAGGHEALQGLFKYRSPVPDSMAMMSVHILWLPFAEATVQINVEALERGTTGMREAAVMMIEGDNWPMPDLEQEPIAFSSGDEMFAHMAAQPLRVLLSDAEKYDATFPDHPLSIVRAQMQKVKASLNITGTAQDLQPFRLTPQPEPSWWRRWFK